MECFKMRKSFSVTWTNQYNLQYFLMILFLLLSSSMWDVTINCEPIFRKYRNSVYSEYETPSIIHSQCQDLTVRVNSTTDSRDYTSSIDVSGSTSTSRNEYIFQFSNGETKTIKSTNFEDITWTAPEPIEFIYTGPAEQEEMGLTSMSQVSESKRGSRCYTIKLSRKPSVPLSPRDTGRYTGRYISNPKKKASVYLYVPNRYPPYLLNTERLVTVNWREGKPLTLPCLLNDPSVEVRLSKRKGLNEWQEVPRLGYDAQNGFVIKKPFNGGTTLYGSYKCFTKLHNRNDTIFLNVIPA